jgi:membrane associated rhomboid family serine protease
MPTASPVTYSILSICCMLYVVSLLVTIREGGFPAPSGGLGGVFGFAAIRGDVLERLGSSLPLGFVWYLKQPWRYVTAIFLHGSLLHIIFNMWVLMDIGPEIEETYGSARYLFIYVMTGVGGYIVSSYFGHFSVGASGALLGLIGLLLATTLGSRSASMQMLRGRLIRWLIYIAVLGLLVRGIDNFAHAGGLATGLLLGKIMTDRPPVTPEARKWAQILGWMTALVVATSFVMMALWLRRVS